MSAHTTTTLSATLPFSLLSTEPSLKNLLDANNENLMIKFNCHHIAKIESFDSTKQTATATINYQKTFFQFDSATNKYNPVLIPYPSLADCPVIVLGGGPASLTFPIQKGDDCLVLFNDRDMDNWFFGSSTSGVATPRLHSFADGIIIVGLRPLASVLKNYDMTRAVLQNGSTMVGVGASKVKVSNSSYSLNGVLQDLFSELESLIDQLKGLCTDIAAITVTCAAPGNPSTIPVNSAVFATVSTQLDSIKTQITTTSSHLGALLE
jgi:hypothetical protein